MLPVLGKAPRVIVWVCLMNLCVDGLDGARQGDVRPADVEGADEGHVGGGVEVGDVACLNKVVAVSGPCGGDADESCKCVEGLCFHFGPSVWKE